MGYKFYTILTLICLTFNVSSASNSIEEKKNILNKNVLFKDLTNIESKKRPCNVYVEIVNSDGTIGKIRGRGGDLSWDDCGKYKDQFVNDLKVGNVKFEEDDVTVVWG